MNDTKLRKLKRDLAGLVEKRRRERALTRPCPECGLKPLAGDQIRVVEPDTEPCQTCEATASDHGVSVVTFWPPRGDDAGAA